MATNFLNPASLSPEYDWKPQGFLAGVMGGQKQDDYRRSMDDQLALQQMGLESTGMDLQQQRANVPLLGIQRQVNMESARGALPFAEQKAREGSLANIASSGYEQVQKGPEGQKNLRESWDEQRKSNTFQQRKREVDLTTSLLEATRGMDPSSAQAYLEKHHKIYKDKGYDLPNALLDPRQHSSLQRALVESTKYLQDYEKENVKDKRSALEKLKERQSKERIAEQSRMATVEAARIKAKSSAANLTPNKALSILTNPNTDPRSPEFEAAYRFMEADVRSKLKVNDMDFGLMLQYMQEAGTAKNVEEAQAVDQKYLKLHMMSKNPVLNRGDPRTSGGQINQGPTTNNSDPLGLFQ